MQKLYIGLIQKKKKEKELMMEAVKTRQWFDVHPKDECSATFLFLRVPISRHEQPRGAGAGGARLPDAVPSGLPLVPARADGAVLEERPGGEAHLWVPAGLFGGLLHCHWASVPARG